jgi:hypothetical protein
VVLRRRVWQRCSWLKLMNDPSEPGTSSFGDTVAIRVIKILRLMRVSRLLKLYKLFQ